MLASEDAIKEGRISHPRCKCSDLINCILDTQGSLNIKKNGMRLLNPNH